MNPGPWRPGRVEGSRPRAPNGLASVQASDFHRGPGPRARESRRNASRRVDLARGFGRASPDGAPRSPRADPGGPIFRGSGRWDPAGGDSVSGVRRWYHNRIHTCTKKSLLRCDTIVTHAVPQGPVWASRERVAETRSAPPARKPDPGGPFPGPLLGRHRQAFRGATGSAREPRSAPAAGGMVPRAGPDSACRDVLGPSRGIASMPRDVRGCNG